MADLQATSPPLNGAVFGEDCLCCPSPPSPASNPDPSSVGSEAWSRSDSTTREILCRIQPTMGADQKRMDVVDYVQRLIQYGVGCKVYLYGSVPLKTYLPDGDIDLTALSCQKIEDTSVSDVHAVLWGEEINEAAEYKVKDVRVVDAEVDRLVGKDHLFKRSIILIKAWCYYESRILGAHHGLI